MIELDDIEYDRIWTQFEDQFEFRPSVKGPFPAILEPPESITFHLAQPFEDEMIDELQSAILSALKARFNAGSTFYYLDWQHTSYKFTLLQSDAIWATGFPDGDYAIILSEDMRSGTFGHPWEFSICLFGREFVNSILANKPKVLANVIRNNGNFSL